MREARPLFFSGIYNILYNIMLIRMSCYKYLWLHGCTAARLHCFAPPGVFWRSPKKNKKPRVVVFNIYIYIYMYILLKTFAGFARRNPPAKRYEAGSQGKERVIYDPFQPFQPVEKSPPWASQHLVCSPRST